MLNRMNTLANRLCNCFASLRVHLMAHPAFRQQMPAVQPVVVLVSKGGKTKGVS